MTKLLALTLALSAGIGYWTYAPQPAHCTYCSTLPCYNHGMCGGGGCVCIKRGLDLEGYCASLN
jgi:hypothetical protein